MHSTLPNTLHNTPLDIVGDIHGEIEALEALLSHLGYDQAGKHPDGRTLVFLGDLCDRGPDSPAVIAKVKGLIEAGRAVSILGNHELNILRGEHKHGNEWFWGGPKEGHKDQFHSVALRSDEERDEVKAFFSTLPLTLSRPGLRIVHAAWDGASFASLAELSADVSFHEAFARYEKSAEASIEAEGLAERVKAEKAQWHHQFADENVSMPMLTAVGLRDERKQMLNPIRVLTSGVERLAKKQFFTSGQWRFAERVKWWDEYQDEVPVVVGHYWRRYEPMNRAEFGKNDADLFDGVQPASWVGAKHNVFCVDYSVGGRFKERASGKAKFGTRLAALRWPERELVFDDGESVGTTGFGGGGKGGRA